MKICHSTKRIIADLIDYLENYGNNDDLLLEMRTRLIHKEDEFFLMFTQDNQGVEVILKRLNYEMETHSEESKMINTLLEAMCLLIDMSPREIKKNIEKNEDGTKIILKLASELCKGTYKYVRVMHAATFLTFNITEKSVDEISEKIDIPKLIGLIKKEDYKEVNVRMAILGLLNELLLNSSEEKRYDYAQIIDEANLAKTLSRLTENSVKNNRNLQRELYYVQHWSIYKHKKQMNTLVDSHNHQDVLNMIKELRRVAFDKNEAPGSAATLQKTKFAEAHKTLGFESHVDPTHDFQSPPGFLALTLMHKFATNEGTSAEFTRLVMESNSCPFAKASIYLVKVLCKVFHIDTDPNQIAKPSDNFYNFILKDSNFLQKLFDFCLPKLFLTWKDMRASLVDFDIVIDVLEEQILYALGHNPQQQDRPSKIGEFTQKWPSYTTISETRKEMNKLNDDFFQRDAIKALISVIEGDIISLIQQQRLNYISSGTLFTKQRASKSKYVYVKLSPNKKTLCYGDWKNDDTIPEIDALTNKITIGDFLIGNECMKSINNVRGAKGQQDVDRFISIRSEDGDLEVELCAPENKPKCLDYWCDALNTLLGRPMTSKKKVEEYQMLLETEIELRILDIKDDIPDKEPLIPPLPDLTDLGITC